MAFDAADCDQTAVPRLGLAYSYSKCLAVIRVSGEAPLLGCSVPAMDRLDVEVVAVQLRPQLFGIKAELCSPAAAVDVDLLVGAVEAGHQQPAHTNQPPHRARVEPDR